MEEDCITIMRGEIEDLNVALGLLTTLHPDLEIDIDNPVEMAEKVVAHVEGRIAELTEIIERQNHVITELRLVNAFDAVLEKSDD